MKKNKTKRFKYSIGELVACYSDPETYRIIIGYVYKRWHNESKEYYKIYWTDRGDNEQDIQIPIDAVTMKGLKSLLKKAIKQDVWEGKELR